jgi:microcystin-dependent protein
MATITGFTAARMLEIEDGTVVDAEVVGGELILIKHDGTQVNAGSVVGPAGPVGPGGPAGGLIPGEIRLWPNSGLPELANYGLWGWADGAVYAVADHPITASHTAGEWRTFGGASDPGVGNFRVPDLRGLVPAGMDQMPGGARANRMTRSVAIILAGKTGKETHIITIAESPSHAHVVNAHNHGGGNHAHSYAHMSGSQQRGDSNDYSAAALNLAGDTTGPSGNIIGTESPGTNNQGGGGAHENVQPTVFIPYIVKLDD